MRSIGRAICLQVLFLSLSWSPSGIAFTTNNTGPVCGNARYEDFFRIQYEKEKAERERQKYAGEVKEERAREKAKMEEARKAYHREKKPDDSAAERAWLAEQKAEAAKHEALRKLYVQERDRERSAACHAFEIPEMQEYDLQDY